MAHLEEVAQWATTVAKEMPLLSPAQARVLGWWSYGMVYTQSCACHTIAVFLGLVSGQGYHALRQRLREWCYEADQKRGLNRQALDVTLCVAPLLAWVLRLWRSPQLTLALDATSLGDRLTVLSLSVVYRNCALPVAWKGLRATEVHAWRPAWLRLLRLVRPAIPPGHTVLVLADRGLYARSAFPAHCTSRLASFLAHQQCRDVLSTRAETRRCSAHARPAPGPHLAWAWRRL